MSDDTGRNRLTVEWDDGAAIVRIFDGNGDALWDARLSDGTPLDVIAAVINLAMTATP